MALPQDAPAVIIGGGPAGLTAAYTLVKRGVRPVVLEKSDKVGGIARTENHNGYRFDIGGHRFFTKVDEVQALWHEVLEEDFLKVPRLSRIFYGGRFYSYPLDLKNTLSNLGAVESARILLSFLRWKARPHRREETFEQWVTNRFGRRLYNTFFRTYTEKVWGIPCSKIRSDWAAQRIKGLSLTSAVVNALFGTGDAKTLIKEFDYPKYGPGQMWECFRDAVEARGGTVRMQTDIVGIRRDGSRITGITARRTDTGETYEIRGENFISSMPLPELIFQISPAPPAEVLEAARGLSYRDFILVGLILKQAKAFDDNWIYVHSPDVKVGRIQNFRNWSRAMVPDPDKHSLGMEYFCTEGDDLWKTPDADLVALAGREIEALGLATAADVEDGVVIRQEKAYPVYDETYREHLAVLQTYINSLENLQTIGRNGMHRYNNQDHSMLTGILAAENVLGERHDLWGVNTERSYHEDFVTKDKEPAAAAAPAEARPQLSEA